MNILASSNVKNTIEEATVIINYWANKWITELWKLQDKVNYFFCDLGIKKLSDQIDKGMQWFKKQDATYKCPYSALFWSRFPTFGLNTERYGVSLRIPSKCGKIRARITPNTDTFYAVVISDKFTTWYGDRFSNHLKRGEVACNVKVSC